MYLTKSKTSDELRRQKQEKMEETTFTADPMRLMLAAAVGIVILLVLIIKFKLHPVLSMMISAIIIGAGAGMPLEMISDTVEKRCWKDITGNRTSGRTGFHVRRNTGSERRRSENSGNTDRQIRSEKSRLGTGTYRTGDRYNRIF